MGGEVPGPEQHRYGPHPPPAGKDASGTSTLLDEEFLLLAIVSTSVMNLRFEYRNPIVCKWGENMMVNVGRFL